MKVSLLLCVIFTLLPEIYGISCSHSLLGDKTDGSCIGDYCFTLQQFTTIEQGINGLYKGCLDATTCNPISFSLSTSSERHTQISTACCSNDFCNANLTLSVPDRGSSENGVKCPICEKPNGEECTDDRLTCTGAEEKCVSLVGISTADQSQNISLKGCATPNVCSMKANETIAFKGTVYSLHTDADCNSTAILTAVPSPSVVFLPVLTGYFVVNLLFDL